MLSQSNGTIEDIFKELATLRAEMADLRNRVIYDPYSDVPYISPGITDRHNIGQLILKDKIARHPYALGVWLATIQAVKCGLKRIHVIEFGVASGAGLINLCDICRQITASTDMEFEVTGFDSDIGMPELIDYRDHPEIWHQGQFLSDHATIRSQLPPNATLISGNIGNTLADFSSTARVTVDCPVGFVSIDVDLYSSTKQCMPIFEYDNPSCYLPATIVYIDDVNDQITCNNWTGEELAISEFNETHPMRKLQELRVRQNHPPRGWHDHIFGLHVLNHPARTGELAQGLLHNFNITAL